MSVVGDEFYYRFECSDEGRWSKLVKRLSIILKREISRSDFEESDWQMIEKL